MLFLISVVAKNGDVCISILHEPGEDKFGYEKPEERWLPIHTVETIMISVISMLADPNSDSPANVDAAVSLQFCTADPPYSVAWIKGLFCVCLAERVERRSQRWVQEEGRSMREKKPRDGIRLKAPSLLRLFVYSYAVVSVPVFIS